MRIEGSPVRFVAGGSAGITLGRPENPGFIYRVTGDRTITKNDTIVALLDNRMKRKVYVETYPKPLIEFGKACSRVKERPVVDTLTAIRDRVKEVLSKFK